MDTDSLSVTLVGVEGDQRYLMNICDGRAGTKARARDSFSRAPSVHLGASRLPTAPKTSLKSLFLSLPLNTKPEKLFALHARPHETRSDCAVVTNDFYVSEAYRSKDVSFGHTACSLLVRCGSDPCIFTL